MLEPGVGDCLRRREELAQPGDGGIWGTLNIRPAMPNISAAISIGSVFASSEFATGRLYLMMSFCLRGSPVT
jgi:hypothetical protein